MLCKLYIEQRGANGYNMGSSEVKSYTERQVYWGANLRMDFSFGSFFSFFPPSFDPVAIGTIATGSILSNH